MKFFAIIVFFALSGFALDVATAKNDVSSKTQQTLHILDAKHPVSIPPKSSIVAEGDSLTYGADMTASGNRAPINGAHLRRSLTPYPETLAADLDHQIMVINRGYPGDRTTEGLKRWQLTSSGDLTLIMYGTNDCENYGNSPGGSVSLENFHAALTELVKRRQRAGAKVVILLPPPVVNVRQEFKLGPYRQVAKDTARETGAYLFDTVKALYKISVPWIDGVHLKPEAYAAIAHALSQSIKVQ